MAQKRAGKARFRTTLWWIGLFATLWWAVTCLFVVLIIWQSRYLYVQYSVTNPHELFPTEWIVAIKNTYKASGFLDILLLAIVVGWLAGGFLWLHELKRQSIPYRAALKDLFATIRK
jgi:hypothetical protein